MEIYDRREELEGDIKEDGIRREVVVYTEQPTRDLLFFLCCLLSVSLHKSAQRILFCIMGGIILFTSFGHIDGSFLLADSMSLWLLYNESFDRIGWCQHAEWVVWRVLGAFTACLKVIHLAT